VAHIGHPSTPDEGGRVYAGVPVEPAILVEQNRFLQPRR
jgi:hypothetical protein